MPKLEDYDDKDDSLSRLNNNRNDTRYNSTYNSNYNSSNRDNNAGLGDLVSTVKNTNEDWLNRKWRPAMGWSYLVVCLFDFVLGPVLWSIVQAAYHGKVELEWSPLTLQGAGLYHIAMGAILGITAYGRTKEKIEGKL